MHICMLLLCTDLGHNSSCSINYSKAMEVGMRLG